MLYDYECDSCSRLLEDVYQSVKDDPLVNCPSCKEDTLTRVITGGAYAFVKNANTIGTLADRNAKNNKSLIQENKHKASEDKPTEPKAWYDKHKSATNKEVQKMTKEQKSKYIIEGKS